MNSARSRVISRDAKREALLKDLEWLHKRLELALKGRPLDMPKPSEFEFWAAEYRSVCSQSSGDRSE